MQNWLRIVILQKEGGRGGDVEAAWFLVDWLRCVKNPVGVKRVFCGLLLKVDNGRGWWTLLNSVNSVEKGDDGS